MIDYLLRDRFDLYRTHFRMGRLFLASGTMQRSGATLVSDRNICKLEDAVKVICLTIT